MSIYTTKYCRKCQTTKSTTEFYKHIQRKDGLRTYCKQCMNRISSDYTINNPNKVAEYQKQYRIDNIDILSDYIQEYQKQYRIENRHLSAAQSAKRRATKLNATPTWAELDLIKQLYDECKLISKSTGIKHHVDHKVPLHSEFVCGLHCIANLQILTAIENSSKSNSYWPDM